MEEPTDQSTGAARVEALLMPHAQTGDWAAADAALEALDPEALDPEAREAWHRFRGVAAFRCGRRDEAFERFQRGLDACPDSAELRFSLAQEHEFRGQPEAMLEHFDAMLFPRVAFPYALAAARFAYLWGDTARAEGYLAPVLDAFLVPPAEASEAALLGGLPPFAQAWYYALTFATELGTLPALGERLDALASTFEAAVIDEHRRYLAGWISEDFSAWVAWLDEQIAAAPSPGALPPLMLLQRAVFAAQATEDIAEAAGMLAKIRLDGPVAEPWLEDARLLATCELLARRGESEPLVQMTGQFFERQPFMLEPDAAAASGLIRFQAGLRDEYRRRRGELSTP